MKRTDKLKLKLKKKKRVVNELLGGGSRWMTKLDGPTTSSKAANGAMSLVRIYSGGTMREIA